MLHRLAQWCSLQLPCALVLWLPMCGQPLAALDQPNDLPAQHADLLASLQRESQWLRGELEHLQQQKQRRQQQHLLQHHLWSSVGGAKGTLAPKRGRILVLTLCAGTVYFGTHCGAFFASFERAYGPAARENRVVAFTTSVDPHILDIARDRFVPWATFEAFEAHTELHDDGTRGSYGIECDRKEGDKKRQCQISGDMLTRNLRTGSNVIAKFHRAAAYLERHGADFDYAIVMDSDVLFVQPLDHSSLCPGAVWDVGFTAYGPDFTAPWADSAADVGRTKRGFVRINVGVVVLRLIDL